MAPDPRRITYLPLDTIAAADRNPKRHDLPTIQRSITRFGFVAPAIVDDRTGQLVAGHGRLAALRAMRDNGEQPPAGVRVDPDTGAWLVPTVAGWASRSDAEAAAYLVADNHHPTLGGWDDAALAEVLADINTADPELLTAVGYDLAALDVDPYPDTDTGDGDGGDPTRVVIDEPDAPPPAPPEQATTRPGDLWLLGDHRIICGDTTDPATLHRLLDGDTATVLHADPPYGMGKEADGIANDNLYGPRLDAFQMAWWRAWKPHLADNASIYIWGNAPDLWRLWYVAGLATDDDLTFRNEIVWDKKTAQTMRWDGAHSYPNATERCLFAMRGQQFLGNQNKADYWEGYEPLRTWLCQQRDQAGWTNRDVNQLTGTSMAGHWFTRSQFQPISRRHYQTLQQAAAGRAFNRDYDELLAELFPDLHGDPHKYQPDLSARLRETRTHFDNTHDTMCDVWEFPRVEGEERYGHATPKPLAMVERVIKTSSRPGDLIAVPFAGTCPEVIAAHMHGRRVAAADLEPVYVDVVCRRFQQATGIIPVRVGDDGTKEPYDFSPEQ